MSEGVTVSLIPESHRKVLEESREEDPFGEKTYFGEANDIQHLPM